uniref:Uncharacterized protein n=1 Tax=Arundo donax TaxID=35708 RepID=A0A0A9CIS9_ARUDO
MPCRLGREDKLCLDFAGSIRIVGDPLRWRCWRGHGHITVCWWPSSYFADYVLMGDSIPWLVELGGATHTTDRAAPAARAAAPKS